MKSLPSFRRLGRQAREFSYKHIHPRAPRIHYFLFLRLRRSLSRLKSHISHGGLEELRSLRLGSDSGLQWSPPLVSIVVPAFEHAAFLEQRLQSIYGQSYRNFEVILLDDASTDRTPEILTEWAERFPACTRISLSKQNSGQPFSQWRRGIELAKGELIWVAESDDYCAEDFLEKLVPSFADKAVSIAFGQTEFVASEIGQENWGMSDYVPELGDSFWSRPFQMTSHSLVNAIWSRRNIIPNASGMLFRNPGTLSLFDSPAWSSLRICGDWWLYLTLARGGLVAYEPLARNYYRQHQDNASLAEHRSRLYMEEHLLLAEQVLAMYRIDGGACEKLKLELRSRAAIHLPGGTPREVSERIDSLAPRSPFAGRKPNILMVVYAMIAGGAEILPLRLANLLHGAGYPVTLLNCTQYREQPGIRDIVDAAVPVVDLDDMSAVPELVEAFGIDLVHSHNAWVDSTLCDLLSAVGGVAHVVTSHGMYDALDDDQLSRLARRLCPWLAGVAYVADKNRPVLERMGFEPERLQKISNTVEQDIVVPLTRADLGVPEDSLLLCMASRGIREKGWEEAIAAVGLARDLAGRDIRLVILGQGSEKQRLERAGLPFWVQLRGFRRDVQSHYAAADLGILPTWFPGESHPLTVLECLSAGRPFVVSDIGDVRDMMSADGGLAGTILPLAGGKIDVSLWAETIAGYARDGSLLERHTALAKAVSAAHDNDHFLNLHEHFYRSALSIS